MKYLTHIVLVCIALLGISLHGNTQTKDSIPSILSKHLLVKIDVFGTFRNCLSVAIEKDLGYKHSLELGVGFFKGESDPDYIKQTGIVSGAFIRIGPKYYLSKNNFRNLIVKKSQNSGYYLRPEMVAQYSYLYQPRSYPIVPNYNYNPEGHETHEYLSFGSMLNFGCQYEIGKRLVVDGFVGLGITYLIESVEQSASPYYFATLENTYSMPIISSSRGVGLGSQAGLKLGVKLF